MSILVIGGTGFIGSHVSRHLIREAGEKDVVIFDAAPHLERIADIKEHVKEVVTGDILEPIALMDAMKKHDVDRVIHLAAMMGPHSAVNPSRAVKVNCVGTTNVFEACRTFGVKRVVYTSSAAVHPPRKTLEDREGTEDEMPHPQSMYGACKLFNELEAEFYWRTYGLDAIGIRPPSVVGTWRLTKEGFPSVWGDAPGLLATGRPATVPPAEQIVDWIYAPDAALAYGCALRAKDPPRRVYNMTGGTFYMREWISCLRKLAPEGKLTIRNEPESVSHLMSNKNLRTELGFKPRYDVEKGLTDYIGLIKSGKGQP